MSNFLLSPKRAVKVSHKSSFHLVLLSTWLTEVFKWLLWVLIRSLWVNILSFRVTLLLTQLWSKHYKATDTRLLVKVSFLRYQNPLLEHRVCYWEKTVFAWKIPWTKEPGMLQSIWSQRVRYNWVTKHTHTHTHRIPFICGCFLPGQEIHMSSWNLKGSYNHLGYHDSQGMCCLQTLIPKACTASCWVYTPHIIENNWKIVGN